ncbi:hypothetical protein QE152_g11272 [Popillia japonica]|uniref:Integrase catalytic domain-containing protein n=1 Tax=Popillia japonica TaxID=7064 RepID=A0AAW1LQS5_POPJA
MTQRSFIEDPEVAYIGKGGCLSIFHEVRGQIIKDSVSEWKRVGNVSETTSPYTSPLLNSQTMRLHYPTPSMNQKFERLAGNKMFTTVDLSSGYLQIPLNLAARKKTASITENKTELFSRLGIPETVRSDNGPQFQSNFKKFSSEYNFFHITSSPYFPQSNGSVERAVKTAKDLLKKNVDINLALMAYRSTPLESGFSPIELLMNRKMRTLLPVIPFKLNEIVDTSTFSEREEERKIGMKEIIIRVIELKVYVTLKSCQIQTDYGIFRRNRWHLVISTDDFNTHKNIQTEPPVSSNDRISSNDSNVCENNVESEFNASIKCADSTEQSEPDSSGRPTRNRSKPVYLKDYILTYVCN